MSEMIKLGISRGPDKPPSQPVPPEKSLQDQITEQDRLLKYDKDTVRDVTALGDKDFRDQLAARESEAKPERTNVLSGQALHERIEASHAAAGTHPSPEPQALSADLKPESKLVKPRVTRERKPKTPRQEARPNDEMELERAAEEKRAKLTELEKRIASYEEAPFYDEKDIADLKDLKRQRRDLLLGPQPVKESRKQQTGASASEARPASESEPNPLPRYQHRPQSAEANAARNLHEESRRNRAGTQERARAADQAGERKDQQPDAFAAERAQAEEKFRQHELLRKALEKVTTDIIDKKAEREKISVWKYFARDRITEEIKKFQVERQRLEDTLSEKISLGTRFTESVGKHYKAAHKKFQEWDTPYGKHGVDSTTLNLSGAHDMAKPSEEDIARVEAEARDDQAKAHPTKTFIKQRIKGFFTFGISEFRPAEKYRRDTGAAAQEMGSLARLIQQDNGRLSVKDAEDQANEMKRKVKAEGLDISDPRFMEISAEITARRIQENDAVIKEIIVMEIKRLEERLKNYRTESGGEVLTEENKDRIATELHAHLLKQRAGAAEVDVVELTKTIRTTLDDKWKRRYAYGVADILAWTAIFGGGYMLLSGKEIVAAAAAGGDKVLLEKTLSHISVKMLHQAGFSHPTQAMIKFVTEPMAIQNKVAVINKVTGAVLWKATAGGVAKDIAMAKGTPIMISAAQKAIIAIKAGAVAGI